MISFSSFFNLPKQKQYVDLSSQMLAFIKKILFHVQNLSFHDILLFDQFSVFVCADFLKLLVHICFVCFFFHLSLNIFLNNTFGFLKNFIVFY